MRRSRFPSAQFLAQCTHPALNGAIEAWYFYLEKATKTIFPELRLQYIAELTKLQLAFPRFFSKQEIPEAKQLLEAEGYTVIAPKPKKKVWIVRWNWGDETGFVLDNFNTKEEAETRVSNFNSRYKTEIIEIEVTDWD